MTRNPQRLRIRRLGPSDRDRLAAAFDRLSPRSRYLRFMAHKPSLSNAELTYFTHVDHATREALGAFDPTTGELIGVARYATLPGTDTVADLAITVTDDWQGLGLGTMLACRILYRAADNEIERLHATTLVDNLAARALLRRLGFRARGRDADVLELALDLPYPLLPNAGRGRHSQPPHPQGVPARAGRPPDARRLVRAGALGAQPPSDQPVAVPGCGAEGARAA